NTFSNLISTRFSVLNLLLLNFGYHNAHHARPKEPWFRLPAVHDELFGESCGQVVLLRDLLTDYHRYRVKRILDVGYGQVNEEPNRKDATRHGAVGVSILY
ncbi:MAG TPA: fatty acid desaturase, partial [Candidatus Nanopelagicales bacterium]|nr:fatty acid desaturase [Candidatus Nanopelagicales bacterium]